MLKQRKILALLLGLASTATAFAADAPAFTPAQLNAPPTQNWITNGGTLRNQRDSPLKEINVKNVYNLKGVWQVHLNGSGFGPPYSAEAQPIVHDGIIYLPTGADDVFAIDVDTGKFKWVYQANLEKGINTICCGWDNRGVGLGEGKVFVGRLDGKLVALDQNTGKEIWSVQAERWQEGLTITSAPLYYEGMVITGFAGAEYSVRGRIKAYDAKDGKLLWTFYTIPAPGEFGSDTWPSDNESWKQGGGTVWHTPAVDPELGLIYFSTGNAGPDYNGSKRKGDNLFTASIVALDIKTGKYKWHFQEVHHDIWDYDAPNPVVLFDLPYNGKMRKGLAQVGKTGWVYILDRTNGKPLIGIDEKPVPQEPRQFTSPTQPIPRGEPTIPQEVSIAPYGSRLVNKGRTFTPYWDVPVISTPGPVAGPNWAPSSYHPELGFLYVCANDRIGRYRAQFTLPPMRKDGDPLNVAGTLPTTGIFTAMDMRTNKIVWQQRWDDRCYSGSITTAGGLVFTGRNDGRFVAMDASNGDVMWEFQTGAGVNATATVFEHKGKEHIVIFAGGSLLGGAPPGDNVWLFSMDGKLGPVNPPAPPASSRISMTGANAEAGKAVFAQYCSQCHGVDGKGGHDNAPALTTIRNQQQVLYMIMSGRNSMPAVGGAMKPEDVRDVTEYVTRVLFVDPR